MQHPVSHTEALSAVPRIFYQTQYGVLACVVHDDLCCVIARAIVDHNDLGLPAALTGMNENFFEGGGDPTTLVVSRKHDAVSGQRQIVRRWSLAVLR